MADVNKSVEVSVRADLKQLLNNLKQIPGMTEAEAKKMVANLNKQLRQTEAASKKAAQVSQQATKQMAAGFDRAAVAAKNTRKQSREIGAALGSLEDVVGGLNPELAGMATEIGIAGQAFRSLSRSLATGNPIIMGLIVAVGAAAAAYTLFTSESRKAKEIQEGLAKALEETKSKLEAQANMATTITNEYNNASRQLAVLSGQMRQVDADTLAAKEAIQAKTEQELEQQDEHITKQQNLLALAEKAKKARTSLTEEEEKTLNIALAENKIREQGTTLQTNHTKVTAQMNALQDALGQKIQYEQKFRGKIVETRNAEYQAVKEMLQLQEELRKEQEEEEKRQKNIQEAKERAAKRMETINQANNTIKGITQQLDNEIYNSSLGLASSYDKINMQYNKGLQELQAQREEIQSSLQLAQETAKTNKEREQVRIAETEALQAQADIDTREHQLKLERQAELDELTKKYEDARKKERDNRAKEEKKIADDLVKQIQAGIDVSIQGLGTFASSSIQFLQNMGEENKGLINALFMVQKAAALADIAMSTARAVARAPADYGPLAPAAVPLIIAGGAAQAAVVASQSPPMHMGGIVGASIAPDEQNTTLLKGEAVLDRNTTARLGKNGINRLQNGGDLEPSVVVISPFKHLDRYNRSAMKIQKQKGKGSGRY